MNNPQIENGHLDIANELVEVFSNIRLSPNEWNIIWAVWRKTYCWHKKEDWISFRQFRDATKMADSHISRTIKKLTLKKILTRSGKYISFNKHYKEWNDLPKQVSLLTQTGNSYLPKQVTPIYTKETHTKEIVRPSNKLDYLLNIPIKDFDSLKEDLLVNDTQIRSKGEELHNYCQYKGRIYKNYKAFLRNALKKDFPQNNLRKI